MTTSSFTQGAALPNITTTQNQQTTAPSFYTDYLNNLASQGQSAVQNANYVGAQPLQQQAFNQVGQNVGNYQPALAQAGNLISSAAGQNIMGAAQPYLNAAAVPTSQTVNQFMSPYTNDVVNAIGNLGENNIARNLAPQATAGIVGSGGFGSSRGQQALGEVLANAGQAITGQQAGALESGYTTALQAAQNQANLYGQLGQTAGALTGQQATNQLNAGNAAASLAGQTQNLGLNDVNALATLGGQQQTIAQNAQLFPMQQLSNESALLRGYSIPTGTSSTYTGPIPGAYQASPLQQIAGLGALAAGVSNTNLGAQLFGTPGSGGSDPNAQGYVAPTSGLFGQGITGISKWLTGGTSLTNMNTSHSEGGQIVLPEEITSTPKKTKRSSKTKKVD